MSNSRKKNDRYLARLWLVVIVCIAFFGIIFLAALTSGDPKRVVPVVVGTTAAVIVLGGLHYYQKRLVARMLRAEDPRTFLASFARATHRVPHGSLLAAANSATILALYGRLAEAEETLESVSWHHAPPIIQAQESTARAAIAYVKGNAAEGLEHAVAATSLASLNPAAPGARTAELAFRTYRNVGMALASRDTEITVEELRLAFVKLPLVGQILSAWALAVIARRQGADVERLRMETFLTKNAPHFAPLRKG
jgi:hypothetical protein